MEGLKENNYPLRTWILSLDPTLIFLFFGEGWDILHGSMQAYL